MTGFSQDNTLETNLRSIFLLGANTATYKFALAKSLLDLKGSNKTVIKLDDITPIYANHLLEHIKTGKKQITSNGSKLISAIDDYAQGRISEETMLTVVRALGFKNVIDAFHNLPGRKKAVPFYEKALIDGKQGLVLTDELFKVFESDDYENMKQEVEGRWVLVESAWGEQGQLRVRFDSETEYLYGLTATSNANFMSDYVRKPLIHLRVPFNGYQKGECFYCNRHIEIESNHEDTCQVDHFLPHHLMTKSSYELYLDEVWNLVLACKHCNGYTQKAGRMPAKEFLPKLAHRNEYFIESNLPIKETIIYFCGRTPAVRRKFLYDRYEACKAISNSKDEGWKPREIFDSKFLILS